MSPRRHLRLLTAALLLAAAFLAAGIAPGQSDEPSETPPVDFVSDPNALPAYTWTPDWEIVHYWAGDARIEAAHDRSILRLETFIGPEEIEAARAAGNCCPEPELLLALYPVEGREGVPGTRSGLNRGRFSLKPATGRDIAELAAKYGFAVEREVPWAPGAYIAKIYLKPDDLAVLRAANALKESGDAEWATPLIERRADLRFAPNDPLFPQQWNLLNTGENAVGGVAGNDMNLAPAWDLATGSGVVIAVVDEGVEHTHPDLAANFRADLDLDINFGDDDVNPLADPQQFNFTGIHGTACAGCAGAVGDNNVGTIGAAYGAQLTGIRLVQGPFDDEDVGTALSHRLDEIDVFCNAWGPSDNGSTLAPIEPLAKAAIEAGIAQGRGGLGAIYMWAAGNGRCNNDDVNLDGLAASRYTIAVAATGAAGEQSWFSEEGAAILVNASSASGACSTNTQGTLTTDRVGSNGYTAMDSYGDFGGTSAAVSFASGVAALILEANPNLTWRDVQHVFVRSAFQNSPEDDSWRINGAGLPFSHKFGFGRIDALKAVQTAQSWVNVGPVEQRAVVSFVDLPIPDNDATGYRAEHDFEDHDFFRVEHVEMFVDIQHPRRGDLEIEVRSPAGTVSTMMHARPGDANANYSNVSFTSVAFWGERLNGTWSVVVRDTAAGQAGMVATWGLDVFGHQVYSDGAVVR